MLQIGGLKRCLTSNERYINYRLNMHIYWARKNILKDILDGAGKKG